MVSPSEVHVLVHFQCLFPIIFGPIWIVDYTKRPKQFVKQSLNPIRSAEISMKLWSDKMRNCNWNSCDLIEFFSKETI